MQFNLEGGKGLHLGKKVILILGYIFRNYSNFTH